MSGGHTPEQVFRFERELAADPALVERIFETLPPVEEVKHVLIKTDSVSVDSTICKALALAVLGIEARLELTTQ
jgi:hypothetical protein